MKTNFLKTLIVAIAALGMVTIQSCDTDPCKDVECGANGVCLDGACICDEGYDGTDCNIVIRSLFTGTYNVVEVCSSDTSYYDNYVSRINESATGAQYVVIDNIYNHFASDPDTNFEPEDVTALASVSVIGNEYVLLIDNQGFNTNGLEDFSIEGSGTYNTATSEIIINYTLIDNTADPEDPWYRDDCTQIYTPQ